MAMKGCSTFSNAPALLEPHHQITIVSYQGHLLWMRSYPSAEVQSVYSTAPADWVIHFDVFWTIFRVMLVCDMISHSKKLFSNEKNEMEKFFVFYYCYCILFQNICNMISIKNSNFNFFKKGKLFVVTRQNLSVTGRQIYLPRKQRLINQKRHRHTANEGMDSYR